MKRYPSIPKLNHNDIPPENFHIFDKLDGTNLRISWAKGKSWYDFATRTRSISFNDPLYGEGFNYFLNHHKKHLESIIKNNKWQKIDCFFEFLGDNSFAGRHFSEPKRLVLIDVAVNNQQLMSPSSFLNIFSQLPTPNYIGLMEWDSNLMNKIKKGELEGVTFEGIVGKNDNGLRFKIKSQAWIDKVLSTFHQDEALNLVNS